MQRPFEILLVESDADLAAMLVTYLHESLQANVTHVQSAEEAFREELTARHDLLLAAMSLPDGDGLELVRQVRENNRCPAILMAQSPTAGETIAALRLGVADFLTKPFDMEYLLATVRKALKTRRLRCRELSRHRRLRKLVARIICERRDLAQRIDLICRDFVQAHRRLAEKVTQSGLLANREK